MLGLHMQPQLFFGGFTGVSDPDLFAATEQQLGRTKSTRLLFILAIAFCFAAAWLAWLLFARVTVYASTDQARIEVAQAVYPVEAAVSGRVVKSYIKLGKQVRTGDVLLELEADPEKLRLFQEQSHHEALELQLENLGKQLAAEQEALQQETAGGRAGVDQARIRLLEAQETARLAQEEFERDQLLLKQGLISEIGVHISESNAKQKAAEVKAFKTAVDQASSQELSAGGEHRARIDAIKIEIVQLQGQIVASETTQKQLAGEVGAFYIQASGSGQLGSIANLKPGAYIHQGDRLATIIPRGGLRIVAEFEPHTAIGRVRAGQTGRMRLSGFPWAQYGSVNATVTNVGSEVRDGRIRVELDPRSNARVPLQHGLPGTLEVAIDRVSPLALLLEKAGDYSPHAQSAPVPTPSQ